MITNNSQNKTNGLLSKLTAIIVLIVASILIFIISIAESETLTIALVVVAAVLIIGLNKLPKVRQFVNDAIAREKTTLIIVGLLLALAVPLPLREEPYVIHILVIAGIYIILTLGLNIQVGSTGIPNLGFAAFFGVGAYASSLITTNFDISFWTALIIAAIISALFGFLLGFPSLKTRSYHLALVSIAFGLVTYIFLNNLAFTGGPNGVNNIPAPELFGKSMFSTTKLLGQNYPMQLNFYYLVLFFIIIMVIISHFFYNSRVGLNWNAVREDEIAAKCSGINVTNSKLMAFSIGAFYAGVAGALYAHFIGYISPQNFNMNISLNMLGMVILGGMDNILGASLGAFLLAMAPEKFRALANFRVIASGSIIILMLMFRPAGIIPQKMRDYGKLVSKRLNTRKDVDNG